MGEGGVYVDVCYTLQARFLLSAERKVTPVKMQAFSLLVTTYCYKICVWERMRVGTNAYKNARCHKQGKHSTCVWKRMHLQMHHLFHSTPLHSIWNSHVGTLPLHVCLTHGTVL